MTKEDFICITRSILDNDWNERPSIKLSSIQISQFTGTAFDSDYQCYRIDFSTPALGPSEQQKSIPRLVAKNTVANESIVLKLLSGKAYSVPAVLACVKLNSGREMVYEEFCPGTELYSVSDHSIWVKTAILLARIHEAFWNIDSVNPPLASALRVSPAIHEKLLRADQNTCHNQKWNIFLSMIISRFNSAPKTLIHGDMFPTNVITNENGIRIIDWADSCICPYFMDIGRLTAIIDTKTNKPMCPCPDEVIKAYFNAIQQMLQMEFDKFRKDILMAQFIELAAIYSPQGLFGIDPVFNRTIETRLNEILDECHC